MNRLNGGNNHDPSACQSLYFSVYRNNHLAQNRPAQALAVIQTVVNTAEQTRSPLLEIIEHTRQEIEQALQEKIADPF